MSPFPSNKVITFRRFLFLFVRTLDLPFWWALLDDVVALLVSESNVRPSSIRALFSAPCRIVECGGHTIWERRRAMSFGRGKVRWRLFVSTGVLRRAEHPGVHRRVQSRGNVRARFAGLCSIAARALVAGADKMRTRLGAMAWRQITLKGTYLRIEPRLRNNTAYVTRKPSLILCIKLPARLICYVGL